MPGLIWVKKKEKKAVPTPDPVPPEKKSPQTVQVTVVKIIDNVFGRKKKPTPPAAPKKKSQRTTEQKQEIGKKALGKLKNVISSKKDEQKEIGDQLKDIKDSHVEAASYKEGKGEKEIEQLEEQGQAIISVLKDIPKKKEEAKKLYEDVDEEERKKRLEDIYLLIDSEDSEAAEASRPKWMFKTIPTGSMATLEELFGFIDLSDSSVIRWKFDGFSPVRIEDEDDHEFCSSDCYIVLNIPEQDAKSKMLTLHYWIGKESSIDKQCLCAMRSVQLNSFIRGRAKHYREEEGNETVTFLELFRGEVEFVNGEPTQAPLKAVKRPVDPPALYRFFTFKKQESIQKIAPTSQAFTKDAVLLLVTCRNIFQWNGSVSPSKERYRAFLVARALQIENSSLVYHCLEEGDAVEDIPDFCQPFFDALSPSEEGEEDRKKSPIIPSSIPEKQELTDPLLSCLIYRFERDPETGKLGMKTAWEGKSEQPPQQNLLSKDFVYLLDFYSELFIWRGSAAAIRDQQTALILATKLKTTRESHVTIKSFVEGTEKLIFKLKFPNWVILSTANSISTTPSNKLDKITIDPAVFEQLTKDRPQLPSIEPPQGTFEVYMFSAGKWGKLKSEERGEFYSGNPHFILYSYPKGLHEKQRYLAYFWQGKDCDFRSWSSFSLGFYPILSAAIGKKGGSMSKTLIYQQAEPAAFMKLFQDSIVIHHGKKEDVKEGQYRLYRARTEPDDTSYIVQINVSEGKVPVQDKDTLLLQTESKVLVWKQKEAKSSVTDYALKVLKGEREVQEIQESRSSVFWSAMSGPDSQAHLVKLTIPRLFSFSYIGGALSIDEFFKISQENFISSNCYILTSAIDVFCWIGGFSIPSLEEKTITYAEAFSKRFGIPFHIQREGSEEASFTQYFNPWTSKIRPADPQIKRDENFRKLQDHEIKLRLQSEHTARKAHIERLRKIEEEKERIRKELEAAAESERKEAQEREFKRLEEQRKKWEEEEKERIRKEEEERQRQEDEARRKREEEAEPDEDYFSILAEGDVRLAESEFETDDGVSGGLATTSASGSRPAHVSDEGSCMGCSRSLGEKCIEVLGGLWHPHCFLCKSCNKSLFDGFVLNEKDQKPYCPSCFAQQAAKFCPGCTKLIEFTDKTLTACEKKWHVDCFVCTKCKKDLSDGFIEEGGMPYCDSCEEELFSGTCARCQKSLGSSSIQALDQQYHRNCFCCVKCSASLEDGFIDHEDELYCEKCYESIFSRPCTRCKQPLKAAFVNVPDGEKLYPFHPTCITCEVCSISLLESDFEQKGTHLFCLAHAKAEPKAEEPKKNEPKPSPKEKPKDEPKANPKEKDLCYGCKKPLKNEEVKAMGQMWHPDCFVCTKCKGSLDDGFIRRDEMPYCEPCIEKIDATNKKQGSTDSCAACGKALSGKTVEIEDDEIYHKACFVCVGCGNNFDDCDFFSKNGKLYCEECHP